METAKLEKAIERVALDESYQKAVAIDPGLLIMDYQLTQEQIDALKDAGAITHEIKEVRPTAICCTCVAPA